MLVTRNGRDYIVLMSVEDLESIEATLEFAADPEAQRRVAEAEAEIERGDTYSLEEVREELRARYGR